MTLVAIIGAGSIGSRHNNLLNRLGYSTVFVSLRSDLETQRVESIEDLVKNVDVSHVLIANETYKHAETVLSLQQNGFNGHLLVEKPLGFTELDNINNFASIHCAFNLRFHPGIEKLFDWASNNKVISVEAYAGQHLSTWRPDRNLQETYSSSKALGGGVLRDLSHELDYLSWIFGKPTGVFALGGRFSQVTSDSDDNWAIISQNQNASTVSLQLNYLDIPGNRFIKAIAENESFHLNFSTGDISYGETSEKVSTERDDSYQMMLQSWMTGNYERLASLEDSIQVERQILAIETSSSRKEWISL